MSLERHPPPASSTRPQTLAAAACLLLVLATGGCDAVLPPQSPAAKKTASPGPEHDLVERPPDQLVDGKILLGSPSLTAGITGNGPLTLPEVEAWLADPRNHEPLDFVLPLGLRELADQVKIPADNPLTRAKIELGRQLFVDPRLSSNGKMACFSCHVPMYAFTDHALVGDPERGVPRRAPPPLINRIFGEAQFWDGRADSLEAQALQPIYSPYEMASSPAALLEFLRSRPAYARQFEVIFGGVSEAAVAQALASFVRAIVSGDSPYDRWRARQNDLAAGRPADQAHPGPLSGTFSKGAERGLELFAGKAKCTGCHTGPNFTDEKFHNVGIGALDTTEIDAGREKVSGDASHRAAFKTPTLRNVGLTGPYMHRSQLGTLEAVIEYLSAGGAAGAPRDPLLQPVRLTKEERRDLAAFLRSLAGSLPSASLGRLPQ